MRELHPVNRTAYLFSTHRLQWPFSRLRETESGYRFLKFAVKVLTSVNPDTGADSHSLNREHSLMLSIYKINEPAKGEEVRPSLLLGSNSHFLPCGLRIFCDRSLQECLKFFSVFVALNVSGHLQKRAWSVVTFFSILTCTSKLYIVTFFSIPMIRYDKYISFYTSINRKPTTEKCWTFS
jgi:hypothetical protein